MPRVLADAARTVLVLVVWLVVAFVAIASGFAGREGGWLWALLAFAVVPAALVALTAWRSWRWPAAVGAVGLVLAWGAWAATPISSERLLQRLDRLEVPDDWQLVAEDTGRDSMCFDACPYAMRSFAIDGDARREAARVLVDAGYEPSPVSDTEYRSGRFRVRLSTTVDGVKLTIEER